MFELPSLPTDSLYKFLFIGGLSLIIAAFIFSDRQYNSLMNDKSHKTLDSLQFEVDQLSLKHSQKTKFLTSEAKAAQQADYTGEMLDKIYILYKNKLDNDTAFKANYSLLAEAYGNRDETFFKNNLARLRSMIKDLGRHEELNYPIEANPVIEQRNLYVDLNKRVEDSLQVFNIYIYCSGIAGTLFAFVGIIGWYSRLQRPQDQTLTLQIAKLKQELKNQIAEKSSGSPEKEDPFSNGEAEE